MTTEISLSIDGDVATALVRTESGMNVLCGETLDRIAAVAADVADADGVRFFKLVAEGRVFVAGADIKELAGLDRDGAAAIARRGVAAFDAIADLPCVTIARLHGAALGRRAGAGDGVRFPRGGRNGEDRSAGIVAGVGPRLEGNLSCARPCRGGNSTTVDV